MRYSITVRRTKAVVSAIKAIDEDVWDRDVEEQRPGVIEAMLSGCAIVEADSGAIPQMMSGAGVVFNQRDPMDAPEHCGLSRRWSTAPPNFG